MNKSFAEVEYTWGNFDYNKVYEAGINKSKIIIDNKEEEIKKLKIEIEELKSSGNKD